MSLWTIWDRFDSLWCQFFHQRYHEVTRYNGGGRMWKCTKPHCAAQLDHDRITNESHAE